MLEVFENLCFHGGHGSTLEMRVFSEASLKEVIKAAGFDEVEIVTEDVPEFGVQHAETWSLPIVARKGRFVRPAVELAEAYRYASRRLAALERQMAGLRADYDQYIEFHERSHTEAQKQLAESAEWVRKVEADFEERTRWAQDLDRQRAASEKEIARLQASELEAWQKVAALEREIGEARTARAALESRLWTRTGRKFGLA
jgi:hypothetical protein